MTYSNIVTIKSHAEFVNIHNKVGLGYRLYVSTLNIWCNKILFLTLTQLSTTKFLNHIQVVSSRSTGVKISSDRSHLAPRYPGWPLLWGKFEDAILRGHWFWISYFHPWCSSDLSRHDLMTQRYWRDEKLGFSSRDSFRRLASHGPPVQIVADATTFLYPNWTVSRAELIKLRGIFKLTQMHPRIGWHGEKQKNTLAQHVLDIISDPLCACAFLWNN